VDGLDAGLSVSEVRGQPVRAARGLRERLLPDRTGLLIVPALVVLAFVFGYPLLDIVRRSLSEPSFGLHNYETFFTAESVHRTVLVRTLMTGALITAVCLLLGYPYAYLMTIVGPRWRALLVLIVLVPFWTSLLVRTYAWMILLQENGVINDLLASLGIGRLTLMRNLVGVTIGMAQILLPFMVLPLYSTMRGIDETMVRAASSLGARPVVTFFRVYLPLSLPGVVAGSVLVFVTALGFYITPSLLGSPQQSLISQVIASEAQQQLDFAAAGASGVTLLIVAFAIIGVASRVVRISSVLGGEAVTR
jgi:putative spermidine/putrescine transport system permease protein